MNFDRPAMPFGMRFAKISHETDEGLLLPRQIVGITTSQITTSQTNSEIFHCAGGLSG